MKIILAGGSGQIGNLLARHFHAKGDEVVVLSRRYDNTLWRTVLWDAKNTGGWTRELEGADCVINLAGRSVNCRYTPENRRAILQSRVESTRVLGRALAAAKTPPPLWLQAATATLYAHRYDAANDEETGIIGGDEPNAPDTWNFSIEVAKSWEAAAQETQMLSTRLVLLRSAMVMSADKGGVFDALFTLAKRGLGGSAGDGKQYVSWIHGDDFIRAIEFLIEKKELSGAVNIASPNPMLQRDFMKTLREAAGVKIGFPATKEMLEIGALFMKTETELILKSRRVVPTRLLQSGFTFHFPTWPQAAADLCARRSA